MPEHPWVVKLRQKLRERGYEGEPLEAEMNRLLLDRFPFLRDGLFTMANLSPETTGLPMTVWVSPRGEAGHDVRIKVNMAHGNKLDVATAVVDVRPPQTIAGTLSREDEDMVFAWVRLNTAALVAYWEGQIDAIELGQRLKPLP